MEPVGPGAQAGLSSEARADTAIGEATANTVAGAGRPLTGRRARSGFHAG